jgi:hypothetical protein
MLVHSLARRRNRSLRGGVTTGDQFSTYLPLVVLTIYPSHLLFVTYTHNFLLYYLYVANLTFHVVEERCLQVTAY